MPRMNETNGRGLPVRFCHCGVFAFWSGHSMIYTETPDGGVIAAQSGKVFYSCPHCGGDSESAISRYSGRLYLREVERPLHRSRY